MGRKITKKNWYPSRSDSIFWCGAWAKSHPNLPQLTSQTYSKPHKFTWRIMFNQFFIPLYNTIINNVVYQNYMNRINTRLTILWMKYIIWSCINWSRFAGQHCLQYWPASSVCIYLNVSCGKNISLTCRIICPFDWIHSSRAHCCDAIAKCGPITY